MQLPETSGLSSLGQRLLESRGGEARGAEGRLPPLPSPQELEAIRKVAQILVMLGEQVRPAPDSRQEEGYGYSMCDTCVCVCCGAARAGGGAARAGGGGARRAGRPRAQRWAQHAEKEEAYNSRYLPNQLITLPTMEIIKLKCH